MANSEAMRKESGSLPMVGGYGEHSYLRNSSYQRKMFENVQEIIKGAVLSKLDLSTATTAGPIRIADLGCSVGPNTFYAVQAVVDAVMEAFSQRSPGPNPDQNQLAPEFQVFFNDQVGNDFNVLLSTLPEDRPYFAADVPGSFHSRLFPRDSVHFFNSSGSLHWLSKSPEGAPNKGRVHLYGGAPAVKKAYLAQFMEDMDVFLKVRADELVAGGLLAVLIGCHEPPAANCTLEDPFGSIYNPIFRELLAQGEVKEEVLETFQLPLYFPTMEEFKEAIDINGRYTTHVTQVVKLDWRSMDSASEADPEQSSRVIASAWRSAIEEPFKAHFGERVSNRALEMVPEKLRSYMATTHGATNLSTLLALFILQLKA